MLGFIKRLFSGRIKRVSNYANGLAAVAQLLVCMVIFGHVKIRSPRASEDQQAKVASAWANYLFGQTPSEFHTQLDLDKEHANAIRWLETEGQNFEELVVQGLRVRNTAEYGRTGEAPMIGVDILKKYGMKYPDSPDLDRYAESLLLTIDGVLRPDQKDSVFRFIQTGPYAPYFKNSKALGW